MKTAFWGIDDVGSAIADNLSKPGHEILVGHNNPDSPGVRSAL
jgi:predicted dinucleotide-binding enzyme